MSSKSPKANKHGRQVAQKAASAATPTLPEREIALRELSRRTLGLWLSLFLRILALGILSAIFVAQVPWLRQNRALLDMLSGVLALWPFFTGIGRLHAARIALGRRYAEAERWDDALATLEPLAAPVGRFFDATGEGRYWLAVAYRKAGRDAEAQKIQERVAEIPGGEWAEKARAERSGI